MSIDNENANQNDGGQNDGMGGKDQNNNQNTGGADDNKSGQSGEVKVYAPKGMPDHFLGKTDQETIDLLMDGYKGARDELAKKGTIVKDVPKTADGYTLEIPEDMKDKVMKPGEDGKDPILELFKPIAHKHGIGQKAFQDVVLELSKVVAEKAAANDGGEGEEALADFEYKEYGGADKAKPLIDGVSVWAKGLKNQGKLDDADIAEIGIMSTHSQGLKTLVKLREMTGEKPIPSNFDSGASGAGKVTEAMLNDRVADPRYQSDNPKFEKAFYDETTKMFQEFYNKAS